MMMYNDDDGDDSDDDSDYDDTDGDTDGDDDDNKGCDDNLILSCVIMILLMFVYLRSSIGWIRLKYFS